MSIYKKKPKIYAFVIGINEFTIQKSLELKFAVNDAKNFYQMLLKDFEMNKNPNNIYTFINSENTESFIHTDQIYPPRDGPIFHYLQKMKTKVTENDMFIFFMASHGKYDESLQDNLIMTEDTSKLVGNYLRLNELLAKYIGNINAGIKWLIFDLCQTTKRVKRQSEEQNQLDYGIIKENLPSRTVILFSCERDQVAQSDEDLEEGIFTHYLIKGISEREAVNKDGDITFLSLYNYLKTKIREYVDEKNLDEQSPEFLVRSPLRTSEPFDFVILKRQDTQLNQNQSSYPYVSDKLYAMDSIKTKMTSDNQEINTFFVKICEEAITENDFILNLDGVIKTLRKENLELKKINEALTSLNNNYHLKIIRDFRREKSSIEILERGFRDYLEENEDLDSLRIFVIQEVLKGYISSIKIHRNLLIPHLYVVYIIKELHMRDLLKINKPTFSGKIEITDYSSSNIRNVLEKLKRRKLNNLYDRILKNKIEVMDAFEEINTWTQLNSVNLPEELQAELNGYYNTQIKLPECRLIPIREVIITKSSTKAEELYWKFLIERNIKIPIYYPIKILSEKFAVSKEVALDFSQILESFSREFNLDFPHLKTTLVKLPIEKLTEILNYIKKLILDFINGLNEPLNKTVVKKPHNVLEESFEKTPALEDYFLNNPKYLYFDNLSDGRISSLPIELQQIIRMTWKGRPRKNIFNIEIKSENSVILVVCRYW